jgi:hypothetical protein
VALRALAAPSGPADRYGVDVVKPIYPQPWGSSPELSLFSASSAWQESPFSEVVDINDPDVRYVADAVVLMRLAGLDMTDPDMLRLAVEAGHRKAALVRDDSALLGYGPEAEELRRAEERDIELPGHLAPRPAVVYYMRLGNRCKIGWTNDLRRRVINIQPEELLATEPGGVVTETQRHEQFKALRVVGEWFKYEGTLIEHVEALRSRSA